MEDVELTVPERLGVPVLVAVGDSVCDGVRVWLEVGDQVDDPVDVLEEVGVCDGVGV